MNMNEAMAWETAMKNNRRRVSAGNACPDCDGTGLVTTGFPDYDDNPCTRCAGSGKLIELTLVSLQEATDERAEWIDPKHKLTGTVGQLFFAVEYMGEAGEGGNIIKKLVREDLEIDGSRSTVAALGAELADDIITACNLARLYGIDLSAAIRQKFNETSRERNLPVFI